MSQEQLTQLTAKEYLELYHSDDIIEASKKYVGDMNKQDAEKKLLLMAAEALDLKPEVEITCSCGKDIYSVIKHIHSDKNEKDLFYDFGNVKIQFKYPSLKMPTDAVEQFLDCIYYVVIDDNKYTWSEVDDNQMSMLMDYFTFDFIQAVLKKLNFNIYSVVDFKCPHCKAEHSRTIVGFGNLLEFFKL